MTIVVFSRYAFSPIACDGTVHFRGRERICQCSTASCTYNFHSLRLRSESKICWRKLRSLIILEFCFIYNFSLLFCVMELKLLSTFLYSLWKLWCYIFYPVDETIFLLGSYLFVRRSSFLFHLCWFSVCAFISGLLFVYYYYNHGS